MAKSRKRVMAPPAEAEDRGVESNEISPSADQRPVSPQSVGDTTAAADSARERIAQRAYELYMLRGGGHGRALDDWLAAERELAKGRQNDTDA